MKSRGHTPRDRQEDSKTQAGAAQQERRKAGQDIPRIEWIAGIFGLTLTCVILIFLLYRGFADGPVLADIVVEAEHVSEISSGYVVEIRASNRGARTLAGVKIEGELKRGGTVEETAETTFTYLPARSERRGGLFFSNDPRQGQLTLRPKGFETP
jgi:uncharacterized protein (TIGR02588 family)